QNRKQRAAVIGKHARRLAARATDQPPLLRHSDESQEEKVANKTKQNNNRKRERHGGSYRSRSVHTELSVLVGRAVSVCQRRHSVRQPGASGIMAAVTVSSSGVTADSARVPNRSSPGLSPRGHGRSAPETWKRDIVRQLKHRDLSQHIMFQDLIRFCTTDKYQFICLNTQHYTRLLEKTSLAKGILSCSVRRPSPDSSSSISSLLHQNTQLKKTTGELAYQVVELQQKIKIKECVLEKQHAMLVEKECRRTGAFDARQELQEQVRQVEEENRALKREYDALLERQRGAETRLREEKVKEGHLLEDMIHPKQQAAARMNSRNERRSRAREANLQKHLQTAARSKVTIESSSSAPTSRSTSPKKENQDQDSTGQRHTRLFRSASATSPRLFTSIKELFEALQVLRLRILAASYDKSALLWRLDDSVPKLTLTGHSRKVTAARFSTSPHQVVTGSADRTVRLWDLHRAACVQVVEVASYCSDLVCSENSIISGHFDSKIRVWDTRAVSCVQELPAQGKVTSLDLSTDHRQLLSCCRDDCLQLVDLRRWSNGRMCFRAEGFKCGSDSTKAVVSPDSCFLAAGSADGTVYIWNVSTGNLETQLPDKHSSSVTAVSWSLSGEYIVSVDKSRRAVLWSDI
ncbi:hypothetical protein INR49_018531, partial [Caranx melampygus]